MRKGWVGGGRAVTPGLVGVGGGGGVLHFNEDIIILIEPRRLRNTKILLWVIPIIVNIRTLKLLYITHIGE